MDTRRILSGSVALSLIAAGLLLSGGDSTPGVESSRQTFKATALPVRIPILGSKDIHSKLDVEQVQEPAPPPPPPPPPPPTGTGNGGISESPPEKQRILTGPARAQLKSVERALPRGSAVYICPVGLNYETAAMSEADVDGDGVAETIVVHTQRQATASEPRPPLMLSMLSRQGRRLVVRMSISLVGNILFNVETSEGLRPLVIQDITGDGQPEIVLAPGPSASLGGWLEAYDVDRTHFRRRAHINGRYFRLNSRAPDKPVSITTRWMEEDEEVVYKWNGTEFQSVPTPR